MATCTICGATLTSNPASVSGRYEESASGSTLLESRLSVFLGLTLCTHHLTDVIDGNDQAAISSVVDQVEAASLTLTSPTINGTIATTGLTIPAFTLGGTMDANSQALTNVLDIELGTASALGAFWAALTAANA
ncbi:hypothetical protein LCGC14_1408680, partial [marine sediment metagenome]